MLNRASSLFLVFLCLACSKQTPFDTSPLGTAPNSAVSDEAEAKLALSDCRFTETALECKDVSEEWKSAVRRDYKSPGAYQLALGQQAVELRNFQKNSLTQFIATSTDRNRTELARAVLTKVENQLNIRQEALEDFKKWERTEINKLRRGAIVLRADYHLIKELESELFSLGLTIPDGKLEPRQLLIRNSNFKDENSERLLVILGKYQNVLTHFFEALEHDAGSLHLAMQEKIILKPVVETDSTEKLFEALETAHPSDEEIIELQNYAQSRHVAKVLATHKNWSMYHGDAALCYLFAKYELMGVGDPEILDDDALTQIAELSMVVVQNGNYLLDAVTVPESYIVAKELDKKEIRQTVKRLETVANLAKQLDKDKFVNTFAKQGNLTLLNTEPSPELIKFRHLFLERGTQLLKINLYRIRHAPETRPSANT